VAPTTRYSRCFSFDSEFAQYVWIALRYGVAAIAPQRTVIDGVVR